MKTKTEISLQLFNSTKCSVATRLKRLRTVPARHRFGFVPEHSSPIEEIGVFSDEVSQMEEILKGMQNRLDNAKVTIEI